MIAGRPTLMAVLALVGTAACGREASLPVGVAPCTEIRAVGPPSARADLSVVLIVNDTMRRDRLGAYGGPARTPTLDAFAREHLVFERAVSQSPWTKPAIATLFTGLQPSQHRVATDPQLRNPYDTERTGPMLETDVLSDTLPTLARVMRDTGFATAAFVSNPWLDHRFGFDSGFETYDDSFARWGQAGEVVSEAALAWVRSLAPGTRFFLYLHYLDSHLPYRPLARDELAARADVLAADDRPLSPMAQQAVQMLARFPDGSSALAAGYDPSLGLIELSYDGGLTAFDESLAVFLDGFRDTWAWKRSAVVITSDHGEALFARGYGNHGTGLFDDELAIPFVARLPETEATGDRIDCPIGLIDVLPTLCAYLSLPCPTHVAGVSFIARDAAGPEARRWVVSEGVVKRPTHRAIRNERYKLIWETGPRGGGQRSPRPYALFDLIADPEEQHDLLAAEPVPAEIDRVFKAMRAALHDAVPAFEAPPTERAPVDPQLQQRLRALGYTD